MKKIGYKASRNFACANGFKFEIGKTYEESEVVFGKKGFHYCLEPFFTLTEYVPSEQFKLLEIEDLGEKTVKKGKAFATNRIKILREVPLSEHKLFQTDKNGHVTYYKKPDGYEEWRKYDEKGNCTEHKDSYGVVVLNKLDANGNLLEHRSYVETNFHGEVLRENEYWETRKWSNGIVTERKTSLGVDWKMQATKNAKK